MLMSVQERNAEYSKSPFPEEKVELKDKKKVSDPVKTHVALLDEQLESYNKR